MDFLRRQLFYIICAIVGLGGIFLAVNRIGAMPEVSKGMEESKRLYDQLKSIQSKPLNQQRIALENERIELTLADRNKVVNHIRKDMYHYQPLAEDAFPDGSDESRRRFRRAYGKAMRDLFDSLGSGRPAGKTEVKLMKDKIEDEAIEARESGKGQATAGPLRTRAGVLTEAGIRLDPVARANVGVAQRIYCFAVPLRKAGSTVSSRDVPCLDFDVDMRDTGTMDAPLPEEAWRAQIGYWIQKDVVDAIVSLNRDAATEAREAGHDVWVGVMPVKDVISIRVSDYIVEDEDEFYGAKAGGTSEALPCGTPNTVFTMSATGDSYDVVQFTVKLVMDERDILRLVDRISKNTFHTLLRVDYKSLPPNRDMQGKIYGSEPTANVVMDFETILLADEFRPIMPQIVCDNYDAIDCSDYKDDQEEEDEDG